MVKIPCPLKLSLLLAFSAQSLHADNIFQRIFRPRGNNAGAQQELPANSFDVQPTEGLKVTSSGQVIRPSSKPAGPKVETREYLTGDVRIKLGTRGKTGAASTQELTPNGVSPITHNEETGEVSYDAADGIRTQMMDKVAFLKDQAGNSAFFNSLYSSSLFTAAMRKAYFKDGDGQLKTLEQSLILDHLDDPSKFKLELNDLQLAFFNSMVKFVSEHPMLGGKPLRGHEPKIWNALVQVVLSNTIPATPDGVVLFPFNDEYEFRFANYEANNGTMIKSTLVLVDRQGNLLNENGFPIMPRSFKTLGTPVMAKDAASGKMVAVDFDDTVQDWSFMEQLEHVAPNLVGAFTGETLFVQDKPQFDSFLRSQVVFAESLSLSDCFKLWIKNQTPDLRIADCFENAGSILGKELRTVGLEGAKTFGRGALAGAIIAKPFAGINSYAGAMYGGLTNIFGFLYNRYLKKENISPAQINNLIHFVNTHTFKQGEWGIIHPGTDKGIFGVTHSGLITRYRTMTIKAMVGRDVKRRPIYQAQDQHVRLNLAGEPLTGVSTIQYNNLFNRDNVFMIRQAAMEIKSGKEVISVNNDIDPNFSNPEQGVSTPDANTFMKDNAAQWVNNSDDRVRTGDAPDVRDDKLKRNVNEQIKVEDGATPPASPEGKPTEAPSTPLVPGGNGTTNAATQTAPPGIVGYDANNRPIPEAPSEAPMNALFPAGSAPTAAGPTLVSTSAPQAAPSAAPSRSQGAAEKAEGISAPGIKLPTSQD
jgi:hypothetical protein